MKIIFFILFSSIFGFSYSQTVLLNEDFESYQDFTISNIGSWQTLDLDLLNTWTLGGDPAPPTNWVANWPNANAKMAYQIFNPSVANVTNDALELLEKLEILILIAEINMQDLGRE